MILLEGNRKKTIDIRTVDKQTLPQLCEVGQVDALYCCRIGDVAVSFDYTENGKTIDELFTLLIRESL